MASKVLAGKTTFEEVLRVAPVSGGQNLKGLFYDDTSSSIGPQPKGKKNQGYH